MILTQNILLILAWIDQELEKSEIVQNVWLLSLFKNLPNAS